MVKFLKAGLQKTKAVAVKAQNSVMAALGAVTAFGLANLPARAYAIDLEAVGTALTAAETDAHSVAGTVIAIVAGLVVVGVIIGIVRKV